MLIDAVQSVGRFIKITAAKVNDQNFQLHYFYGENENAIRTQVWCTLIAQLLLTVIQKIAQTKKAFSVVIPGRNTTVDFICHRYGGRSF